MNAVAARLFEASPHIRYVAVCLGGEPELAQRPGLRDASSSESDRYEELLVNPALLTLARRRGEIDCGGLEHLLVRYGRFFQLVHPVRDGHLSVAIEPDADPLGIVPLVRRAIRDAGLTPQDAAPDREHRAPGEAGPKRGAR